MIIKINDFKLSKDLIKFLNDPNTKNYLNRLDIEGLYEYTEEFIKREENIGMEVLTPNVTSILYSINIDPFDYLNNIPNDYLNWLCLYGEAQPIEKLIIPGHIKIIGKAAFCYDDIKNIYIEEGVEILKNQAFMDIKTAEHIILPRSLKYIGNYAFSGIDDAVFTYMGTKDEWNSMKKSSFMFNSLTCIECTDGVININNK